MKKLMMFLPVLSALVLFVFTGCADLKSPGTPVPAAVADLGLSFNINGVDVMFDAENPDMLVPRSIAYYGNPIKIEGIPGDEDASVSYMLMDGTIHEDPVLVTLSYPFAGAVPQATVRVIVSAGDGTESDCFLVMEAAGWNVLDMRVVY
ncbi:MAG: hypothetical protein LBQ14_08180 [Treponema sp.]|jgi:hypothetical protein|nr:hypothetical protein [Treponema sp.]